MICLIIAPYPPSERREHSAHRVLWQQLQWSPVCRICVSTGPHSWNGTQSSVATATMVSCLQDMCVDWSQLLERHTEFCGNSYNGLLFAGYVRQLAPTPGTAQGKRLELGSNLLCRTKLSHVKKQMRKAAARSICWICW